jgi:hypothetical protein
MSYTFARFKNKFKEGGDWGSGRQSFMSITAFVGGVERGSSVLLDDINHGASVQLTLGREYFLLNEEQIKILIKLLQDRVDGAISATQDGETYEY